MNKDTPEFRAWLEASRELDEFVFSHMKPVENELPKILGVTVHSIFHITVEYHYQGRHEVIGLEYDDAADLADAIIDNPESYERSAQLAVLYEEART